MINTDNLFVTRFNNKTFNESIRYNRGINKSDEDIKKDDIMNKWIKFDIPKLEKSIKKYKKMIYKTDDKSEKTRIKKEKIVHNWEDEKISIEKGRSTLSPVDTVTFVQ